MASLISTQEIADYHQAINDHFDTFKRSITIHKEPIKKIISSPSSFGPVIGYEDNAISEKIEYIPRSQSFEALIDYDAGKGNIKDVVDLKVFMSANTVSIKVKKEARDYILNDKTEKITFDNKSFNLLSQDVVKNYLGLIYYLFYLEETK